MFVLLGNFWFCKKIFRENCNISKKMLGKCVGKILYIPLSFWFCYAKFEHFSCNMHYAMMGHLASRLLSLSGNPTNLAIRLITGNNIIKKLITELLVLKHRKRNHKNAKNLKRFFYFQLIGQTFHSNPRYSSY